MQTWAARCDIHLRNWAPPRKPASCKLAWGQGLRIGSRSDDTAGFVCAGDTALNSDAEVLPYGDKSVLGSMTCSSAEAGITCKNGAGAGFFISRASYRIL